MSEKMLQLAITKEEAEAMFMVMYAIKRGDIKLPDFKDRIVEVTVNDPGNLEGRFFALSEAKVGEAGWDGDSPMDPDQAEKWAAWADKQPGACLAQKSVMLPDEGVDLLKS